MNRAITKVLATAYWNNSVDRYTASTLSLKRALDAQLIKPVQTPKYTEKEKTVLRKIGYDETYLSKTKTVYWLTELGLEAFKKTKSYKQKNPNLDS